jgi:hypothetical protein
LMSPIVFHPMTVSSLGYNARAVTDMMTPECNRTDLGNR